MISRDPPINPMHDAFVTYLDFELEIGPGRGREYPVAVIDSPAGEAQATMRFPFDELALEKRLAVLQNALLGSGGGPRQFPSPEELVVRNFGRDLFDALFPGEIRGCYEQSRGQAWQEGKGLRLKLRFQPSDLAALPWEFLYDPRQAEYMCLSRNTSVVRYLEVPQIIPPPSLSPPLRVLGIIAGPGGLGSLAVAREKERVETALHGLKVRGLAELTWLKGQTWQQAHKAMGRGDWNVLHFVGQGDSSRRDQRRDKSFMGPAGEEGEAHGLSVADLARLLADQSSLRVALLNAREGARGTSPGHTFASSAALLVRQGIPAVLATAYQVTDEAAIEMFRVFYEALALGISVDAAVAEARKAVSLAVGNSVEWGAPALFTSSPDGLVFSPVGEVRPGQAQVIEEPSQVPVSLAVAAEVVEAEPEPEPAAPVPSPQPIEPELVLIPGGEFLMGSDPKKDGRAYEAEQPQHRVYLPDYHISRTPVTNAQYAAFVKASGYKTPSHWEDGKPPVDKEDYPVVYISWYDTTAYCKWLSEKNGRTYRLPSEAEWEKAARGARGGIYPWGDAWDAERCNSKESGPDDVMPVDAHPGGASPYGVLDMAGNVWEWTGSLFKPYPYDALDGREDPRLLGKRVLRGGAYYSTARRVRCAYRDSGYPDDWRGNYGFRVCVASARGA